MQNLNCSSLENSSADFDQLSTIVENVRNYLNTFARNQEQVSVFSFEIPQELITPLENIHVLLLALVQGASLTDAQKKLLTTCERAVARFYCWILHWVELHIGRCKVELNVDESQQARRTTYEFYFGAMYELRNPYVLLKGHSQAHLLESESDKWSAFLTEVFSPPLVPESQDKIEKMNYWIGELGKFIDDLPRLRSEAEIAA